MTHKTILRAGASVLMLAAVSACGDNNDIDAPDPIITPGPTPTPTPAPTPTPTPTTGVVEDLFGSAFAAIFNRDPTLDPVDPDPGDVPPLAPASDPVSLENVPRT